MTGLSHDLTAHVQPLAILPDNHVTAVPLGLLRACLIHVERFDQSPLFDRMGRIALVGRVEPRDDRKLEVAA